MDNRSIGVFDSGVGGLTVVKEILKILPNEKIIYIGDTARVPWGTRGKEIIIRFSEQLTEFLAKRGVKLIVIACHTASSVASRSLRKSFKIPLFEVISPTCKKVRESPCVKRVGVIGTPATIKSRAWEKALKEVNSDLEIYPISCPLFVPIVEAGLSNHRIAEIMVQEYLSLLKNKKIGSLILACTHYPLLKKIIKKIMGEEVVLINPGEEAAQFLKEYLTRRNALSLSKNQTHKFYFTDPSFETLRIAQKFLGEKIDKIKKAEV